MNEDIAKQKRAAATGLSVKPLSVKPFDDDFEAPAEPKAPPAPVEASEPAQREVSVSTSGVLPVITKPKTRPHSVSGRVSDSVAEALYELSKMTERSQSYLISEMLEANLPAWIAQQKALIEKERAQKQR